MTGDIQKTELMTNRDLIDWLSVLNAGYAKPDLSNTPGGTGTVRETKNFVPFIMSINSTLCEKAGIDCPDVTDFLEFKETTRRR
jgi:hypothetical protein